LLCDVLKLRDTLWPLLQFGHASTVASERQTCHTKFLADFIEISCYGVLVVMRRSDFRVNGTQILKRAGQPKHIIAPIRRSGIPHDIVRGQAKYQGTYLDMECALELCQQYGLNELRMHLQDAWESVRLQTVSATRARSPDIDAYILVIAPTYVSTPTARSALLGPQP